MVPLPTGTPKASKTSAPPFEPGINTCTMGIFGGSLVAVDEVVCDVVDEVVVLACVVEEAGLHPVNPDKIITPHIQIPNSHIFFLNIIQSPHRITSSEHQQVDGCEDDSS